MSTCFFSIIIPVYNSCSKIGLIIDHILKHKGCEYEIIVVDDGSTDGLINVLGDYIRYETIKYVYQENMGVASARNTGSKVAIGKYLIFLDSDDWVTTSWLEDFYACIHNNHFPQIVFCNTIINNGKIGIMIDKFQNNKHNHKIPLPMFKAGAFAIDRSFFGRIGRYDNLLKFGENTELGIRINLANPSVMFISKANFKYLPSKCGGSKNLQNMVNSNTYVLKKHALFFETNNQLQKNYWQATGVAAKKIGDFNLMRKCFINAWKLRPYELKAILRLMISYFPFVAKNFWR